MIRPLTHTLAISNMHVTLKQWQDAPVNLANRVSR